MDQLRQMSVLWRVGETVAPLPGKIVVIYTCIYLYRKGADGMSPAWYYYQQVHVRFSFFSYFLLFFLFFKKKKDFYGNLYEMKFLWNKLNMEGFFFLLMRVKWKLAVDWYVLCPDIIGYLFKESMFISLTRIIYAGAPRLFFHVFTRKLMEVKTCSKI